MEKLYEIIDSTKKAKETFGLDFGDMDFILPREIVEQLLNGKTLALSVMEEYSVFIKVGKVAVVKEYGEEKKGV